MRLVPLKTLYDQDFVLWIEETVKQLKSENFSQLDIENLIEEIETLGRSERHAIDSYLSRLLEHLLKRCYVNLPDCYRRWNIEIRNFRKEIKRRLQDSPSLKRFMLEILSTSYQEALEAMREDYPNTSFPDVCPFPHDIERLLNDKFWEH
jgi:hypothetical protein